MAEWLYEAGIGENRAALIEQGRIVEARIEREGAGPRAGAILPARYAGGSARKGRAMIMLEDGATALASGLPDRTPEGAAILVEILREAIPEPGRLKPPVVRIMDGDAEPRPAPTLLDEIGRSEHPVAKLAPHGADRLEEAGWSELVEEARSGRVGFAGGELVFVLTPAMTMIDVDGVLPPDALSAYGARVSAETIRRLGIAGSIGIDLPLANDAPKALRQKVAAEVDAALPQPFERTAVNGFGFLQIVRRRVRASLPELIQADPALADALALLRRAERSRGRGARTLRAAPAILRRIVDRPDWIAALSSRLGVAVHLREAAGPLISPGDVDAEYP